MSKNYSRKKNSEKMLAMKRILLEGLRYKEPISFTELFKCSYAKIKKVYPSSGQEMVRFKAYELINNELYSGTVKKMGGKFYLTSAGEEELENSDNDH